MIIHFQDKFERLHDTIDNDECEIKRLKEKVKELKFEAFESKAFQKRQKFMYAVPHKKITV